MASISASQKKRIQSLLRRGDLNVNQIALKVGVSADTVTTFKAWHKRKWRIAARKAHVTGKSAKTFTKYQLAKSGYRYMDFDTKRGYEYNGVVDIIGVKRDRTDPDLLTIVLFQVKGGGARVTDLELKRLRKAASRIKIQWNVATKPGTTVKFKKSLS